VPSPDIPGQQSVGGYAFELQMTTQKTRGCIARASCRLAVPDVKHTPEFVSAFCFESTGRKIDILHHVRIGETQPFLLSASYKKWTINLNVVDIHKVLIEISATHTVAAA